MEKIRIDIDFCGTKKDLKNICTYYGIQAKEWSIGKVFLTGSRHDLLDFLKSDHYDMDLSDIAALYPELLNA